MRLVVSCVLCLIAWVAAESRLLAAPEQTAAPVDAATAQKLRQVAGILEYIGGDYRGAVGDDGTVLDPAEYAEQVSMAAEATALSAQAGVATSDPLLAQLAILQQTVAQRRKPEEVARLCREARDSIVNRHGVSLSPTSVPSHADGQRLYAENGCATCHGVDGGAQTAAAAKLDPAPANFLDARSMAAVSPYRAYHALSAGVAGTGMQSYRHLSDAARWSLAFYVLSLRHATADLAQGKRVAVELGSAVPRSAAGLFALTEEDILARLADVSDPAQRGLGLAYLRARAPFETGNADGTAANAGLSQARAILAAGLKAYRDGDRTSARQLFVSAYLDGFEPHEAGLSVHDRELVRDIERTMLSLRQATAKGAPIDQIERLTRESDALLERAEGGQGNAATAFWGALTITLREGLEIALLLTALLALVRKRGQAELTKFVHAGWLLAVGAGIVTWFAAGKLVSGMQRELAEGIAALLSAVVLLGVTHWLLGQLTAKRFMGFLAERLGRAASRSAATGVLGLSFLAVYREALEIVLFFQALLLDAHDSQARVWLGAGIGLCVLFVLATLLARLGRHLRPRPFMLLSSVLLAVLSFALAGKGIRALQEAGVLGLSEVSGVPELTWLGLWPTVEGLLTQGAVLLLLIASAVWPLLSQGRVQTPDGARKGDVAAP
jgi:high-affinity iron transporter